MKNNIPFTELLRSTSNDYSNTESLIHCPVCGFEYNHFGFPDEDERSGDYKVAYIVKGNDDYKAGWGGRGDMLVIPLWCENWHSWELCFGFHKGYILAFARYDVEISREEQLKTMPYDEYLQTPEWEDRRKIAIEKAGGRCQLCNRNGKLHVHHRTYENRGSERDGDLIVLCAGCHAKFHDKLPNTMA